jgi:glutathione peroxidase|uniref:Glutathione peroxidase n=1 Tax=Eutreptiella gymnastica TaxID=73025 RepID=A0A7S4LLH5_9EUGL|mmetsp:Transcript_21752/g.36825  ORF Transcript_21752/g.36825 Transcript_21752/m.36825 type:complete len:112 (+) Transcript_21752:186-521(+)|eukprot:CAMPEP_0174286726 /NCGR_PEP_ID=MMETSP0809-20121228/12781_1 /TAXON_ID=73025 ORGANISM="Eutreptiella gymnastica-like, Strain CCMP1594" /NCGR_SAMPLE_ID=MMETSP0809 /ASSEMBLY_ACC=CAM_ASM_000658 /LENGTH=111 /DNA_ID=CAMNT_0015382901 /DNA_START=169 /DNA_END=504 /DNA_ORIENTATION=+
MKHLYDTYGDKGFTVLAFPCNQFGAQEPGTAAQIKDFVRNRYGGNYPVFDKVNVKGPSIHPVWAMLLKFFPGDVPWNFAGRFLVDKSGTPVKRYDKSASYDQIETDIKSML